MQSVARARRRPPGTGAAPWPRRVRCSRIVDHRPGFPHGTTVLAVTYPDGVVVAGDRRATAGNLIAARDLEKVHPADDHTAVAFAGAVGPALRLVRLFQIELEHFEKIEGVPMSFSAKARQLDAIVRTNLELAMQGMAVAPLLAGYDLDAGRGRVFRVEPTGGAFEEHDYAGIGSGSPFAVSALKKLHRPDLTEAEAARVCVEALYDAADDDTATGGPDLTRAIFPVVAAVTAHGFRRYPDGEAAEVARRVVEGRLVDPTGRHAVRDAGER
jgi:proteasome beta subunit